MSESPKVYGAICAVQRDLAVEGITKSRRNAQQGYNFRGIDDVYNAIAPYLSKHGLCILPTYSDRTCDTRKSAADKDLFYVTIIGTFDLVCSEDGSKHTVRTYGEAMDSADKATNKAMSAAYKYACMQAFSIPTEGDNDADATTHTLAPHAPVKVTPPDDAEERSIHLQEGIDFCQEVPQLEAWARTNETRINALPPRWKDKLRASYKAKLDALKRTAEEVSRG